ncbi:APC family permease [Kitasatospora sp. NPDC059571]|uniref:APC family permease n=1 Tax=Kitasatospora sp. NPDC059571 TaxID=3346871 RepID=UPI00368FCD0E
MYTQTPQRPPATGALHGNLSTLKVVALAMAAAAPLVAMAGTVPLSMAIGNGAGVPGTYVVATVTLLCFAVGYAAISRRVTSAGGFYAYVLKALGRPPAAAVGALSLVAYNAMVVALAGGSGYFAGIVGKLLFGVTAPWWLFSLAFVGIMAFLGYRQIDVSARVLGVLMVLEVAMLAVLDIAIIATKGARAFPTASLSPHLVFSGAPGVAFMFAFASFCGFEAAAIYAREARDPARSIPRATYISVTVIGLFFCLTSWLAVGALGANQARQVAADKQGMLFLGLTGSFLGDTMLDIFAILVITSAFACLLSAHNAATRYTHTLGREGLLPRALGRAHARHGSPYLASLAQSAMCLAVVVVYAVVGLDPYLNLTTTMSGISTLGIVLLEAVVAIAVIAYFRNHQDRHWWRTLLAPAIGLIGLLGATVLLLWNFDTLAGSHSAFVSSLPPAVVALALLAVGRALWMRKHDPAAYTLLGDDPDESPQTTAPMNRHGMTGEGTAV